MDKISIIVLTWCLFPLIRPMDFAQYIVTSSSCFTSGSHQFISISFKIAINKSRLIATWCLLLISIKFFAILLPSTHFTCPHISLIFAGWWLLFICVTIPIIYKKLCGLIAIFVLIMNICSFLITSIIIWAIICCWQLTGRALLSALVGRWCFLVVYNCSIQPICRVVYLFCC